MPSITDIVRLKLVIDDQEVVIENEAHWQEWRTYIDNTFAWIAHQPKRPPHPQAEHINSALALKVAPMPQTENPAPVRLAAGFSRTRPPLGERAIDYLVRVLAKSDGDSSKNRAYEMMVNDGYITDSPDPVRNIHDKVRRKYHKLVSIVDDRFQLTKEGKQLAYQLLGAASSPTSQKTVASTSAEPSFRLSDRQEGNDAIDFILRAGHKLGGSATYDDLIVPMLTDGWQTRSDTTLKQRHTISAIINKYLELVDKPEPGRMKITTKGYERLRSTGVNVDDKQNVLDNSPSLSFNELKPELSSQT